MKTVTENQAEGWVRIVRAFQMYYPDWSALGGGGVEKIEAIVHQLPGLIRRHNSAIATLNQLGYTNEGGEMWKPPLLAKPMLESKILKIMRDCAKESTLAWPHEYEGFIVSIVQRALASDRINVIAEFLDKTGQYVTNDVTREAAISAAVKKALSEQGVPSWLLIEDAYDGVGMLIGHRLTIKDGGSCLIFHDQNRMPGFRVGDDFMPPIGCTVEYRPVKPTQNQDTELLNYMIQQGAWISWSRDDDVCNVWHHVEDEEGRHSRPANRTWPQKKYSDPREAIRQVMGASSIKRAPTETVPLFDIDVSDLAAFRKMCDRALNTWNDAPAIIWEFSNMIDEKLKGVKS